MKKFITLKELLERAEKKKVNRFSTILDKFGFVHILIIWLAIITVFGLIYYFFTGNSSSLFYNLNKESVTHFWDNIYFSFVTSTSTGFGDIVPLGFFKFVSVAEVIFGMILFAVVTSKLVSLKQDIILNEIYEISFSEKLNRVRSSLLLFRQDLNKLINLLESNLIKKRNVDELYIPLSSLEDTLQEIFMLTERQGNNYFTKSINVVNTELIINSILQSFEKFNELTDLLDEKELSWRSGVTVGVVSKCLAVSKDLLEQKLIPELSQEKIRKDFLQYWNALQDKVNQRLEIKQVNTSE